jgi:hypothetical protein
MRRVSALARDDRKSNPPPRLVRVALVTAGIVVLLLFILFLNQGRLIGPDAGSLTLQEVDGASENHIVLDMLPVREDAPALHAALQVALQVGAAAIDDDDDLRETVGFLRQHSDPNAPTWTVEYQGRFFEISWHIR